MLDDCKTQWKCHLICFRGCCRKNLHFELKWRWIVLKMLPSEQVSSLIKQGLFCPSYQPQPINTTFFLKKKKKKTASDVLLALWMKDKRGGMCRNVVGSVLYRNHAFSCGIFRWHLWCQVWMFDACKPGKPNPSALKFSLIYFFLFFKAK